MKSEKQLRKAEYVCGCWIKLGNGERWCISPMPLGKKRNVIIEKLEDVEKAQKDAVEGKADYKSLAKAMGDFGLVALQINYPNLTEDTFDELNLVNIKNINEISAAVKGEKEIDELIELQKEGTSLHDEGEQKGRAIA